MAVISLADVTKRFPEGTVAVQGVNLEIPDAEFIVFVASSPLTGVSGRALG
jgi:ABC-type sugar transport system ATPase subunit